MLNRHRLLASEESDTDKVARASTPLIPFTSWPGRLSILREDCRNVKRRRWIRAYWDRLSRFTWLSTMER